MSTGPNIEPQFRPKLTSCLLRISAQISNCLDRNFLNAANLGSPPLVEVVNSLIGKFLQLVLILRDSP